MESGYGFESKHESSLANELRVPRTLDDRSNTPEMSTATLAELGLDDDDPFDLLDTTDDERDGWSELTSY